MSGGWGAATTVSSERLGDDFPLIASMPWAGFIRHRRVGDCH